MNKMEKWELICRYVSIRERASSSNIKFYNSKEMFEKSDSFEHLLDLMEDVVQGKKANVSLFDVEKNKVEYKLLDFPKVIDKIILFDEYKNYKFLQNMDSWKAPFLFLRGNKENQNIILSKEKEEVVSIVGSRETPKVYSKWIEERIPEKKIIVSGLANGADLIGHRIAIEKNMKIVIFPGYDISKNPSQKKLDVWNYALDNGLIISSVIPGAKTYIQADLIKRNYEMAKVVSATYALYFSLKSGTMNHLKVIAEDHKKIFVPLNIYKEVVQTLKNENIRSSIVSK